MNEEDKKAYAAGVSARLKKAVGEKLADIRQTVMAESAKMAECGGRDAAETILCALDCTYDQTVSALDSWEVPAGEGLGHG